MSNSFDADFFINIVAFINYLLLHLLYNTTNTMLTHSIESFRIQLRHFERGIERINQSNCSLGINIPQCHTIMEIGLAKSLSVNALADKMNLDKSTVSRQVEKLVQEKIVDRIPSIEDRRRVDISLSSKGLDIYKTMNEAMNGQFQSIFKKIPAKELEIFLKVFNQIARSF